MRARNWILISLLILFSTLSYGQLISTGATIVDSDGQSWNNGSWSAVPVNTQYSGPIYYNGVPISLAPVSGTLDGTGTFTTSLYNTNTLTPAGTQYKFIITPNASSTANTITISVTSSDLSSSLNPFIQAPRFLASPTARGYLDLEVINNQVPGSYYYNVTMSSGRIWNGTTWVNSTGSGVGTVLAAPQYRHFIQPNAGTVAVAGPSTTAINAVDPIAQGIGNTDLFATGAGNNGVSNFFTQYPTGYAAIPPSSTDTETMTSPPSTGFIVDHRDRTIAEYSHDTGGVTDCQSNGFLFYYHRCTHRIFDLNQPNDAMVTGLYSANGAGYNLGAPGAGSASGWTVRDGVFNNIGYYNTRGIKIAGNEVDHSYGIGDFFDRYFYGFTDGGQTEGSGEGNGGIAIDEEEHLTYFHGTIVSGGSTGSTSLNTAFTSGQNAYTDGSYLLDITKGGTSLGTLNSTNSITFVTSGQPIIAYNISGTTTTSTAWGVFSTATNASATGQYQIPVSQTITVTMGTSSPGAFVVGSACLAGTFAEQVQVTAVGTLSGGSQSVTFNTRYGWNANSTFIMQGAECGQYASVTGSTWRSSALIIGATSATQVIIAPCSHGSCTVAVSGFLPVTSGISTYPGAEIIANGVTNTIGLAYNTVAWANGDVIEDPHPLAVNIVGFKVRMGQTTPENNSFSEVAQFAYLGPTKITNMINVFADSSVTNIYRISNEGKSATYNSLWNIDTAPTGGDRGTLLDEINAPLALGTTTGIMQGSSAWGVPRVLIRNNGTGGDNSLVLQNINFVPYFSIVATNVPPLPTVLGQIPIATSVSLGAIAYTPTAITGDGTISSTGVLTNTKLNGVAGTVALSGSLTTTAATTDTFSITGLTATGHCALFPTNASAATNVATTYVSAKAAGTFTVTHTATAGMTYDILCTP